MSGADFNNEAQGKSQSPAGDTTFVTSISGAKRTFLPGDVIDGIYQLTSLLGSGGMGSVYACRHLQMGNDCAIKILSGDQLSEEHWARFIAEAQALARLRHPGIVGVYNMGIDSGQFPYFVMDLLKGVTLEKQIKLSDHLTVDQSLEIFIQIAAALATAHAHHIIHRDIKPSNIMLVNSIYERPGSVKVVDFGIARLSDRNLPAQSQTKTGMVFGTPLYMSPEQTQGARIDERSDIYSLGCAMFESLTGSPPFHGENQFQTFMMHQTETPPRLCERFAGGDFSPPLELAVAKMLRKNPADRYQTMDQVQQDLERIRLGKTVMGVTPGAPHQESSANRENAEPAAGNISNRFWKTVVITSVIIFVLAGSSFVFYHFFIRAAAPDVKTETAQDVVAFSANDIKDVTTFGMLKEERPILEERLRQYRSDPRFSSALIKQTNPPGFLFPKNFIVGAIKIGDDKPRLAYDFIPCPAGSRVVLYLTKYTQKWPAFLNKFGPYDLNGLEVRTDNPKEFIKEARKLKGLDQLVFFNSLLKAIESTSQPKDQDNEAGSDESPLSDSNLAEIDTLQNIKTLGLCGVHVHGGEIVKMQMFKKLSGLRLKRVSNVQAVIDALPAMKNIKELMLVAQETSDAQIEQLSHMKNLETLQIRRSKLTPASFQFFKKMPALKHLILDKVWSQSVENQFKAAVPCYEYEPITDRKFWQLIPSEK